MRCPFCGDMDTQVKDSRPSEEGSGIRRRRQCTKCGARFTTYERVQLRELMIQKNSGGQEPFDRDKLRRSMQLALRKRPISSEQLEQVLNSITRQLELVGDSEVTSKQVGKLVMETLADLDRVGFIRYASVYQNFDNATDFSKFLDDLKATMQPELEADLNAATKEDSGKLKKIQETLL